MDCCISLYFVNCYFLGDDLNPFIFDDVAIAYFIYESY